MSRAFKLFTAALVPYSVLLLGMVSAQSKTLRVCGDPGNLPYSNDKLEGFENKIAAVIATELGATPIYTWYPHQRGLARNTVDAGTCDVIFGVPLGLETVMETKPYYYSSYVIAYRKNSGYQIASLDAPELKRLKIGDYADTPIEESLARRGLVENLTRYSLFFDPLGDRDRPTQLMTDLVDGKLDVALPWGPMAGYYAKKLNAPIEIVPLKDEVGVPSVFGVTMGVKKGNRDLKNQLEGAIDRRQADIRRILEDYGVPLVAAPSANGGSPAQSPDAERKPADSAPPPAQDQPPPAQDAAAPPAQEPATAAVKKLNPFTGKADMIAEGRALYFMIGCQACHGGQGGGGMAPSIIDENWKFGSDDETLYKLIKGQIPDQTMPSVYSDLKDDEVWRLLAFVRSVYKGDPSTINW